VDGRVILWEQRRQHALHVAEVLQNLSVKRSNATSCDS